MREKIVGGKCQQNCLKFITYESLVKIYVSIGAIVYFYKKDINFKLEKKNK